MGEMMAKKINFYSEEMEANFIVRSQNKRKYEVDFEGDLQDKTGKKLKK